MRNMIQYQKLTVMQDKAKQKTVVEHENNTFEFFDCSMSEVAEFMAAFFAAEGMD